MLPWALASDGTIHVLMDVSHIWKDERQEWKERLENSTGGDVETRDSC